MGNSSHCSMQSRDLIYQDKIFSRDLEGINLHVFNCSDKTMEAPPKINPNDQTFIIRETNVNCAMFRFLEGLYSNKVARQCNVYSYTKRDGKGELKSININETVKEDYDVLYVFNTSKSSDFVLSLFMFDELNAKLALFHKFILENPDIFEFFKQSASMVSRVEDSLFLKRFRDHDVFASKNNTKKISLLSLQSRPYTPEEKRLKNSTGEEIPIFKQNTDKLLTFLKNNNIPHFLFSTAIEIAVLQETALLFIFERFKK